MPEAVVIVPNQLGLHARAAAQLVKKAAAFKSKVTLTRPDTGASANARSILNVLTLSAGKGCELLLEVRGEDEEAALESIRELFHHGFGEL